MGHNKSLQMQQALRHLEHVLDIERMDGSALPGSAVRSVKTAKKILLKDIRKRRDARARESKRNEQ